MIPLIEWIISKLNQSQSFCWYNLICSCFAFTLSDINPHMFVVKFFWRRHFYVLFDLSHRREIKSTSDEYENYTISTITCHDTCLKTCNEKKHRGATLNLRRESRQTYDASWMFSSWENWGQDEFARKCVNFACGTIKDIIVKSRGGVKGVTNGKLGISTRSAMLLHKQGFRWCWVYVNFKIYAFSLHHRVDVMQNVDTERECGLFMSFDALFNVKF